jgi:dihydrofolate synthase/folylpolyglutamate synthase
MESFAGAPEWLLDSAHNPAGAQALAEALPPHDPTVWLVAIMGDKDVRGVLEALAPKVTTIVCTALDMKRALPIQKLAERVAETGRPFVVEPDPLRAMKRAQDTAGAQGRVLVAGSIFLVGFVRGQLTGEQGP